MCAVFLMECQYFVPGTVCVDPICTKGGVVTLPGKDVNHCSGEMNGDTVTNDYSILLQHKLLPYRLDLVKIDVGASAKPQQVKCWIHKICLQCQLFII